MKKANVQHPEMNRLQSEEFVNAVCSNLSFAAKGSKKILITSSTEEEGKTFMTVRIAKNMAARGKRVVMVMADLRKQAEQSAQGKKQQGLMQYLSGKCAAEDILYPTETENAFVVPAGGVSEMAVPLLERKELAELLDRLAQQFDLVLIDTPAIGTFIDAAEIAPHCDGILLVVRYDSTSGANVKKARKQMERTGCPILGCVLNQVVPDRIESKKMLREISL